MWLGSCVAGLLTLMVVSSAELADASEFLLVTPKADVSVEANGHDAFLSSGCGQQQLFIIASSQFSALTSGDQITGFAFRPDVNLCAGNPCGAFAPTTLHSVTIKLATTMI